MTEPSRPVAWPSLKTRRAAFDRMYEGDPERFNGPPGRFSEWAHERIRERFATGRILELGCGPGRDARRFAAAGFNVHATDYASIAIERARSHRENPAGLRFQCADAITSLREAAATSFEAVYSNALFMFLDDQELEAAFREVRRVLSPGGLHLFSVRSVTDPIVGEGEQLAPDVWRRTPEAAPYRYFRRETIDRLTDSGFERVSAELLTDVHFWFVADRRP
jgi:SAM-dependent methyltransferase